MTLDFDAYQSKGQRAGNIRVNGKPLDLTAPYTYASYWYAGDEPDQRRAGQDIVLLKDNEGKPMDGTEVVVQYLESLPERTADTRGRQHEAAGRYAMRRLSDRAAARERRNGRASTTPSPNLGCAHLLMNTPGLI